MSDERVRIEIADHVAVVTLTRGDKHNALDVPMFEGIIAAAEQLTAEAGVRAVVLHGEGPSFCSGLDVMSIMAAGGGIEAITEPLNGDVPNWFQRTAHDWLQLPVPVIAAIHGNCFGGGLQIALAADIRIATPDARLSVMEVKWGLVPDMSISRTLPRLVSIDVAKELTFTGRVFSGSEARELGVVTRLEEDPLGAARALAAEIAGRSPDAVRAAKRLYNEAWTGSTQRDAGAGGRVAARADRDAQPVGRGQRRVRQGTGRVRRPLAAEPLHRLELGVAPAGLVGNQRSPRHRSTRSAVASSGGSIRRSPGPIRAAVDRRTAMETDWGTGTRTPTSTSRASRAAITPFPSVLSAGALGVAGSIGQFRRCELPRGIANRWHRVESLSRVEPRRETPLGTGEGSLGRTRGLDGDSRADGLDCT